MSILSPYRHGPVWLRPACQLLHNRYSALLSIVIVCLPFASADGQVLTEGEIRVQQEALVWTTEYEGLVDGEMGAGTRLAIRKFQTRTGGTPTGRLTSDEVVELVNQGTDNRRKAGFKQFTDTVAGVSVGIPLNFVSAPRATKWGKHWYGKEAGLAIDTLRFSNDVSLGDLYNKLMNINDRKVAYHRLVENSWFVIAAFEGDAAVYVRANLVTLPDKPPEIRGFSIWMSKDRPKEYQAIPPAMLSSFRSNTDTRNDASSTARIGGPTGSSLAKIPKLIRNPPPIRELATTGAANTTSLCFRGLGECPLVSTFK